MKQKIVTLLLLWIEEPKQKVDINDIVAKKIDWGCVRFRVAVVEDREKKVSYNWQKNIFVPSSSPSPHCANSLLIYTQQHWIVIESLKALVPFHFHFAIT
ncbi:hypothetical protein VNO80_05529 [Phaseolus coccineus]|uniref:Uncharacterized protein n=1 Tax=Phaseolus coccineus TaxID=3886 RepID=A0AAN9NM49_PHACN